MSTYAEFEQRRHELANHILEHRDEFDMATFGTKTFCGTTACLAGTAAVLASRRGEVSLYWEASEVCRNEELSGAILPNGNHLPIDSWAYLHLGLTSTSIFYDDTIDEPEAAAKALLDEPYREQP